MRAKFEQNLGWIVLGLVGAGCLLVMRPFLSALLWVGILSFSTWSLYRRLPKRLGGRHSLAALLLALAMAGTVLLPFAVVGVTLATSARDLTTATPRWLEAGPPAPPTWLAKVPVVGNKAQEAGRNLAPDSAKLLAEATRFLEPVGSWLLKTGLMLGGGVIELALSIHRPRPRSRGTVAPFTEDFPAMTPTRPSRSEVIG